MKLERKSSENGGATKNEMGGRAQGGGVVSWHEEGETSETMSERENESSEQHRCNARAREREKEWE